MIATSSDTPKGYHRFDMAVTLRDIAKHVGLSHATVSFVLNERHDISIPASTRKRVFEAAEELGYRPNLAARALASKKTRLVGIWIPNVFNPYYAQVLNALKTLLADEGYDAMVSLARFDPASLEQTVRPLSWPVDALIAVDCGLSLAQAGRLGERIGPPLISLGTYITPGSDFVGVELADAYREAAMALAQSSRRRIAHVSVYNPIDTEDFRRVIYQEVMQSHDRLAEVIECPTGLRPDVRETVRNWIQSRGAPDALLCYNDSVAIATLRALRDEGLTVPGDCLIVGCDGIEETLYTDPPLSTIAQPVDDMVEIGWRFASNRIKDSAHPRQEARLFAKFERREYSLVAQTNSVR